MDNKWLKYPDDEASYAQRRTIRKILDYLGLSEGWLYAGIKKYINALTMKEADNVIKKLSQIKKK
ncbi:MAG: hypothetical protein WC823_00085 [Parcubacteria group bacterium]|jgi:hypothetical protein